MLCGRTRRKTGFTSLGSVRLSKVRSAAIPFHPVASEQDAIFRDRHCCSGAVEAGEAPKMGLMERHAFAYSETSSIFKKVWLWVIIGVGLGALLHGYVPQEWFTENLGAGQWWSVPVAVAIGIPLYTNVTGIIPIMESLLLKGLPLGTTLAFCMSTVAASLPEVLMLKQVMRWKLLALFLGMLLVIFTVVGWLFNILQTQIF